MAATYHYVYPGLTIGNNDGSSWANAWRSFASINWAMLQTEAATQPVYLYIKKGSTSSANLNVGGSGSSDTNRIIVTTDPADTGANPIILNGDHALYITGKSYLTFQNIEITGSSTVNGGVYVQNASHHLVFDALKVHDIPTSGFEIKGGQSNVTIQNSQVYNIGPAFHGGQWYTYRGIDGGADNFLLKNTTIYNTCEDNLLGGGVNFTVDGCDLSTPGWGDEIFGSGTACADSHPDVFQIAPSGTSRIINNYIHDTPSQGLYFDYYCSTGDCVYDGGTTWVYNNVFKTVRGGSGSGPGWDAGSPGPAVYTIAHKIYNNTFYDNLNGTFEVGGNRHVSTPSSVDIKNNLLFGNGGGCMINDAETMAVTTSDYNILQGSSTWGETQNYSLAAWQAASSQDAHSQWGVNPLWTNAAGGDFTLTASSPAKDAGANLTSLCSAEPGLCLDKAGSTRPQGSGWDIGAYEYVGVAPLPDTTPPSPPTGVTII